MNPYTTAAPSTAVIYIDADTDVAALAGRRFVATWRGQRNLDVTREVTIQSAIHSPKHAWVGAMATEWNCPCNAMHPGGGHATSLALEYGRATLEPVD